MHLDGMPRSWYSQKYISFCFRVFQTRKINGPAMKWAEKRGIEGRDELVRIDNPTGQKAKDGNISWPKPSRFSKR